MFVNRYKFNQDKLLEDAQKVLNNWNEKFTITSSTLFPPKWTWDSCFHVIGNPKRSIQDI